MSPSPTFTLGETIITENALRELHPKDVRACLARHARQDWGDISQEDAADNDLSLKEGFRLLSAYRDRNAVKFWVITEADRSVTTVLLPEDY